MAKNYVLANKPAEFSVRVFEVAQEDIAFIPSSSIVLDLQRKSRLSFILVVLMFTNQTRSQMLKRLSVHLFAGRAENSFLQFLSCAVTAIWSLLSLQPLHSRSYHRLELELEPT